jgi:hypothetical protein
MFRDIGIRLRVDASPFQKPLRRSVPPNTNLKVPTLFTFGGTNPTTLVYEIPENEQ